MKGIRYLTHLPQPDFEDGWKWYPQVAVRRVAGHTFVSRDLPHISEKQPFVTTSVNSLRKNINHHLSKLEDPCEELIKRNIIYLPHEVFLRASPAHLDNWLRDSFITCLSVYDPIIESHFLGNFIRVVSQDGQMPTTRLFASNRRWYFDDESTALALVWRAKIAEMEKPLDNAEKQIWWNALNWLFDHDEDGYYITPKGKEKSWFDTYVFPEDDVITYNQGCYVAALVAAKKLGLSIPSGQIQNAVQAYRNLTYTDGSLKLSKRIHYTDVSCLFGEYLGLWLFDESFLPDSIVRSTMESFISSRYGYRIVSKRNGEYPDANEFDKPCSKGDYQNGAVWPLWDAIAQAVGEKHYLHHDREFWMRGLKILFDSDNAEYIKTNDNDDIKERVDFNHERVNHAWNATVYTLAKQQLGSDFYQRYYRYLNRSY